MGSQATHLDSSLREVVGVPQFRGDVESEVVRVLNRGISQSDAEGSPLFECLLQQQRLQQGIYLFSYVLQQNLKGTKEKTSSFASIYN